MNKENLLVLAAYLETLPENYEHFEMQDYMQNGDRTKYSTYALTNGGVARTTCGAAACAVGHGPAAGFLFQPEECFTTDMWVTELDDYVNMEMPAWEEYASRVFCDSGEYHDEYVYMFGGFWARIDNTPWGAAARIRLICAEGEVPYVTDDYYGFQSDDNSVERYAPYHKSNRSLWGRIKAKVLG